MSDAPSQLSSIWIYHLFALKNLSSICSENFLFSKNEMTRRNLAYSSIAHDHIQNRRVSIKVPVSPGGVLHDYVPFYFATRSPMLGSIHKHLVAGCDESQETMGYLITTVERVNSAGLPFVYTRRNATLRNAEFSNNESHLRAAIDWSVMELTYWCDTKEDGDIKARRQAEFLIWKAVPLNAFVGIGVYSDAIREQLVDSIQVPNLKIVSRPNWYF